MDSLLSGSTSFIDSYYGAETAEKNQIIEEFLTTQLKSEAHIDVKHDSDWEWFNVERSLNFHTDLSDKIVVLDFFTYCCINCLHILPSLHQLEKQFPVESGLVMVGVHSAKFSNERDSENIDAALRRYDITHPVINDDQLLLWQQLGISCWPTLLVLGPGLQPLLYVTGESHMSLLHEFVAATVRRLSAVVSRADLPLRPAGRVTAAGPLRFPGKLCRLDERRLVVSDTGHHRLLVMDNDGIVQRVIGGPEAGYYDGKLGEAKFNSPQGVAAFSDNVIYVADTENHAIRKVSLSDGLVETVAGTGELGADREGGGSARQPLASPWDLCLHDGRLYIAMAGAHQIWVLFLRHGTLFGKRDCRAGTCIRLCGTGEEANRNNSYPHRAAFAQPSGVTCDQVGARLLVADSESSSIRQVALATGAVAAVVGGARDPMNLFEFGDVDATAAGAPALLQHPLGVSWCGAASALYVADTYNHKLKKVEGSGKKFTCRTVCGGDRGDEVGTFEQATFSEPGDVLVDEGGDVLIVADTNNHCIKRLHLSSGTVQKVNVRLSRDTPDSSPRSAGAGAASATADVTSAVQSAGGGIYVRVQTLLTDVTLTDGAPHRWQLVTPLPAGWTADCTGGVFSSPLSLRLTAPRLCPADSAALSIRLQLYLCSATGVCFPRTLLCRLQVEGAEGDVGRTEAQMVVKVGDNRLIE